MNELTAEQVEVLTKMLEIELNHAKSRFEFQFRTFTWWAGLLSTGIVGLLLSGQSVSTMHFPKWVILIVACVVFIVPLFPGLYILRQVKYYWDNMRVVGRIESCLGLFDVGSFLDGESVLPSDWCRHIAQEPRIRDAWHAWAYAGILGVLGVVLAIQILSLAF